MKRHNIYFLLIIVTTSCLTFIITTYLYPTITKKNILLEPVYSSFKLSDNFFEGTSTAPYTIIEIGRFGSSRCKQIQSSINLLESHYRDSIRYTFIPIANFNNREDIIPVLAYLSAVNQSKGSAMKSALFELNLHPKSSSIDERLSEIYEKVFISAENIGLNLDKFETDIYSDETLNLAKELLTQINKIHIIDLPTVIFNNYMVRGVVDMNAYEQVLKKLKKY